MAAVRRDRDILAGQLREKAARLESIEAEAGRQALALERSHAALTQARQDLADRDSEVEALEASLLVALGDAAAAHAAHAEHHLDEVAGELDGHCPCREQGLPEGSCGQACACRAAGQTGLAGKRVLYVGGRCSLVAHYKLLAAKFGCELLHHDGGREQSAHRLWELLGAADAVVCPWTA